MRGMPVIMMQINPLSSFAFTANCTDISAISPKELQQNLRKEDSLSTRDKLPVPKVSSVWRFYCNTVCILPSFPDFPTLAFDCLRDVI